MINWQHNGNLAFTESNETYCLFSEITLFSNIFSANKTAVASKQASTYLNKCLLFRKFFYSSIHSFSTTFMAWNSHRCENSECIILQNPDSG